MKRFLLIAILIGLALSALTGISIFVVGSFDETQVKLLGSTFGIGFFSLTALCASIWLQRRKFLVLPMPAWPPPPSPWPWPR